MLPLPIQHIFNVISKCNRSFNTINLFSILHKFSKSLYAHNEYYFKSKGEKSLRYVHEEYEKMKRSTVDSSARLELYGSTYTWIFFFDTCNAVNVLSVLHDFLGNIFFSLAYLIITIE